MALTIRALPNALRGGVAGLNRDSLSQNNTLLPQSPALASCPGAASEPNCVPNGDSCGPHGVCYRRARFQSASVCGAVFVGTGRIFLSDQCFQERIAHAILH